jgi:hypothetical protein
MRLKDVALVTVVREGACTVKGLTRDAVTADILTWQEEQRSADSEAVQGPCEDSVSVEECIVENLIHLKDTAVAPSVRGDGLELRSSVDEAGDNMVRLVEEQVVSEERARLEKQARLDAE